MNAITAGIDVGGPKKGFHAVALQGTEILGKFRSRHAEQIAAWCVSQRATVIAVDAPCLWRGEGGPARAAERQLARDGISCFSTPTEAAARGHAFYTWMFAGQEIFQALAPTHSLYLGDSGAVTVAIETFPQAVACALAGEIVSAKSKVKITVRRGLLSRMGIDDSIFTNIDDVDAALCALAAQNFARGTFKAYGDAQSGFIITPEWSAVAQTSPSNTQHQPSREILRDRH